MMPTISDNILANVAASKDDEEMSTLLKLFEGTDPALLPSTEILDFVLTLTEDDHLWLAVNDHTATYDAAFGLLSEAASGCLPTYPVYTALEQAVDWADEDDDENDIRNLSLRWTTALALLVQRDDDLIDDYLIDRLKEHAQWQCRIAAIDILADRDRIDEIVPFLTDSDNDVASAAIFALPTTQASMVILDQLLEQHDIPEVITMQARQARDGIDVYLHRQERKEA